MVLHHLGKVVRMKECGRLKVGYVTPHGDVYYGSASNMVLRDVCGWSKITCEHMVRIIGMVLILVIAFELEQEYDRLSHYMVVCSHVFV